MSNKLRVKLIGGMSDNENIRLSEFISELDAISATLNRLDRLISRSAKPTLYFRITDLSHKSPTTVELEAVPKEAKIDYSVPVVEKFMTGLEYIEKRTLPSEFDLDVLDAFGKIGGGFRRNLRKMEFASNGYQVHIKEHIGAAVKEMLGHDEIMESTVSGTLDALNVHGKSKKFMIYPVAGRKIDCYFPDELYEEAKTSVEKYMELRGDVKYKSKARFPFEIEVKEIEVFPDEEDLPTMFDIQGMAPNATGDLSSEEFIAKIREEA